MWRRALLLAAAAALAAACPDSSWSQLGEKCYKVFTDQHENWPDSEGFCEAWDTLANILNDDVNQFLAGLVEAAGEPDAWVGLDNIGQRISFEWTVLNYLPELNYTAWAPGAPAYRSCSGVVLAANGTWLDHWMFDSHAYLCQWSPGPEARPPSRRSRPHLLC